MRRFVTWCRRTFWLQPGDQSLDAVVKALGCATVLWVPVFTGLMIWHVS